jgi:hypothetical protein
VIRASKNVKRLNSAARVVYFALGPFAACSCGSNDSSPLGQAGGSNAAVAGTSGQSGAGAAGSSSAQSGATGTAPTPPAGGSDGGVGGSNAAGAAGFSAAAGAAGEPNGAAGGLGTGGSAGTPTSGCDGLLLCDDFESYPANSAPAGRWKTQVRGSALAVVDTTLAYSGSKSVHFTGTVDQSSANIVAQGAPVFPVPGNTVFVRLMLYIQGYPTTSGVHTRLARIGSSTSGLDGSGYALTTYNGTGIERINEAMVRDTTLHLTDATVKGKWVCWEWEIDNTAGPPASGKGKVLGRLWRDGTAVNLGPTSHTGLSWDPVAWQVLEFGLEAYQSDTQAGDFWIDDVAMNTARIGCPQK